MKMGVVADDLTGANDIGSMFAKAGLATDVYALETQQDLQRWTADIRIVDTNARLDEARLAADKVSAATRVLQQAGCDRFFNKTSSAFVGPVGAYFDAMLDTLNEDFAVVVVGFPKNGRTTIFGTHYVHGKRLEDSEFRNDPIHPMTRSNLVEILQAQTVRRVGLVDCQVVRQGPEVLQARLAQLRGSLQYVVLDVEDQAALATIARAVKDYAVVCGSSALAEELPTAWGRRRKPLAARPAPLPETNGVGVLCAAGSLMPQTAEQIRVAAESGTAAFELNTLALLDDPSQELNRLAGSLSTRLQHGLDVIVHTPNRPDMLEAYRAEASARGISGTKASRLVSETLAEIVTSTVRQSGANRLVVAGGETSAAVSARLGIGGMRVWKEIETGLPSCISLSGTPMLLVFKSGSFGSPAFITRAIEHLKSQSQ